MVAWVSIENSRAPVNDFILATHSSSSSLEIHHAVAPTTHDVTYVSTNTASSTDLGGGSGDGAAWRNGVG